MRQSTPNLDCRRRISTFSGALPSLVTSLLVAGCLLMLGCDGLRDGKGDRSAEEQPSGEALRSLSGSEGQLVLVKFGATWCGPCRQVDQELDRLEASSAASELQIVRVDVDEDPSLAKEFDVFSIPHMVLVRNGEILDQQIGYRSADDLRQWAGRYSDSVASNQPTDSALPSGPAGVVRANPFAG